MKKIKIINPFLVYSVSMSLILLTITVYRALITGITEDEAWTYLHYLPRNPINVLRYLNIKGTFANNHILNSFLISFVEIFFHHNYNEFIIRLPNVLSYVLYLFFAYLITKDTKYKYLNFSLLVLNYGANEFFGLARGYGIACTFVLAGIFFFKKYLLQKNNYFLTLTYLSFLTASYANTSSLIAFAAIIIVSFVSLFKDKLFFKYTVNQIYFLIPIVIASLIIIRYHFLVTSDDLPLYGGYTGSFYSDVLESLLDVYGINKRLISHLINMLMLILIAIISHKFENFKNSYIIVAGILFFVLLIGLTKGTGKMWMTGRCLIPSMPLLIMMIIEVVDALNIRNVMVFQTVLIIPLLILFGLNLNLKATRDYNNHYAIRDACYEVLETKDNTNILWLRGSSIAHFYREKILKYNNFDIF